LNLELNLEGSDEASDLANSAKQVVDTISNLITEIDALVVAALRGNLSQRGNSNNYQGSYKNIVIQINKMLESILEPFNLTADYLNKMVSAEGKIDIIDETKFEGDFNKITSNVNVLLFRLKHFEESINKLYTAAQNGDLSQRADTSQYTGD
jgi:methyl-accepting chemotaxis protein